MDEIKDVENQESNELDGVIERLKNEHQEIITESKERGLKEGAEDAKNMSLWRLKAIVKFREETEEIDQETVEQLNATIGCFDEFWWNDFQAENPYYDFDCFLKGWIEGVAEFYQKIKYRVII